MYPHLVSGAFHSPSGVLFNFPSRYLSTIGLGTYLGLEVGYSRLPTPVRTWYSGTQTGLLDFAYRAITFYGSAFQHASARQVRPYSGPKPHTLWSSSLQNSVWPIPSSLAGTRGISFDFFSSPYLDVSVREVPASHRRAGSEPPAGSPIRVRPDQRLHNIYPGNIAARYALHRRPSRAIHQVG